MKYLSTYQGLLMFGLIYLTACSTPSLNVDTVTPVFSHPTTPNNEEHGETNQTSGSRLSITVTASPIIMTPDESITVPPDLKLQKECPAMVLPQTLPLWSNGSILFSSDSPGIWAIPTNSLTPTLVYDQASWAILSDDGTKLLRFEQNELGSVEGYSIIYDIINEEEIRTPRQANWFILWDWLPDGRLKYLISQERTFGFGEKRQFALVDPLTGESESFLEELALPGYQFYEEPFYTGVASVDPTGKFVLYTIKGEQGTADVALLERETGRLIWQQEGVLGTHGYPYPEPVWRSINHYVLFSMPVSNGSESFYKIFSLSYDGQLEHLPPQPFPLLDQDWQLNYLNRSPDGRYINYGLSLLNGEQSNFIVDTITHQVGEVCDLGVNFLNGEWISENHFLYLVKREDGGKALRVLDVPTWTAQEIITTNPESALAIIGWTPIEFP